MSREIKFRAWDDLYGGRWVYFSLGHLVEGEAIEIAQQVRNWQQFTGLKDKNGTEIFEGDIILTRVNAGGLGSEPDDWVEESGEVYFEDGYFTVKGRLMSGTLASRNEMSEVIGNIYENPELLNKDIEK